jgi:dTDP-4-dehydrorhamnose reductase
MSAPLELWGGIECSVVRISDSWRDQVRETGHHDRGERDLDLLAGLGLRTLRYPVLWERATPGQPGSCGWGWHDRQLEALRRRGIAVVAGLVHHGSGPRGTSLLDPLFPEKLAAHAGRAVDRYPFVAAWTPVNEPLTTARFGCLYAHWHPHERDEGAFLRAVANQCRAALLAMRTIRARLPGARFVHTEDIGRVFATPPLADQAAYENDRRWLSLDLLCGRLGRDHPWRGYMESHGVPARHLDELAMGEAAPDLIGVNHYATSDRFLDHRLRLYPPHLRGGNGNRAYADTEALRADLDPGATGWEPRLREVWARYRRPLAITEAHLGCADPFEQVRWLMEAWGAAQALRAEGAEVRAVTAWALLGLVDWDTMLRERLGRYEPGALDTRRDLPAPTPLADAVRALATQGAFAHAALDEPGWWRCEERVHAALRRA